MKEILLFTNLAHQFVNSPNFTISKVNIKHTNKEGQNALEYHCSHYWPEPNLKTIKTLVYQLGLRLTVRFPHAKKCQDLFPNHFYFQAIIAIYLGSPGTNLKNLIAKLDSEDRKEFEDKILKNSEIAPTIGQNSESNKLH